MAVRIVLFLFAFVTLSPVVASEVEQSQIQFMNSPNYIEGLRCEGNINQEIRAASQDIMVSANEFCDRFSCAQRKKSDRIDFTFADGKAFSFKKRAVEWNGNSEIYPTYILPCEIADIEGNFHVPVIPLLELMGYQTYAEAGENGENPKVHYFKLPKTYSDITADLKEEITGSSIKFSYLSWSEIRDNKLFLSMDHNTDLITFDLSDSSVEKISFKKYGYINKFLSRADGSILVGTRDGKLILRDANGELEQLNTKANTILAKPGEVRPLEDVKFGNIIRLVADDEEGRFFIIDGATRVYHIDLTNNTARLIIYHQKLHSWDIMFHEGDLIFMLRYNKGGVATSVNTQTGEMTPMPCFDRLFKDIVASGIQYSEKYDRWLALSATDRNILEFEYDYKNPNGRCKIINKTYAGDDFAYLNAFGVNYDNPEQFIIQDSDAFSVILYGLNGEVRKIRKKELGKKVRLNFLGPTSLASQDDSLFILSNQTHQVVRYSLSDGSIEPFAGKGQAFRQSAKKSKKLEAGISYSNRLLMHEGRLYVGDHFGRRVLAIDKNHAYTVIGPTDDKKQNGIPGFTIIGDDLFLADMAFGTISRVKLCKGIFSDLPVACNQNFEHVAGIFDNTKNSEVVRRKASRASYYGAKGEPLDIFIGLPRSIEHFKDQQILIVDNYRQGLWLLDLAENNMKPIMGMNRGTTDYHFGGFTANVGLAAQDLRIGSPMGVRYYPDEKLIVIANGYNQSVVFATESLDKTCHFHYPEFRQVSDAVLLQNGEILAVADAANSMVYLFDNIDFSCLDTPVPDRKMVKHLATGN
ncbi:MAG: hypothetical protein ACON49_06700 [Candidatus Puniceispirillaceae bacterium]